MASPLSSTNRAADHDESFEELAAARAIGSIEPAEALHFAQHLAECGLCRDLLAQNIVVVQSLALTVGQAEPSPGFRERLLAAAADEPDAATRPVEPVLARAGTSQRLAWALPLAAVLLISLGLGWWNVRLQEQISLQQAQLSRQQTDLERQQRLVAVLAGSRQRVALIGTDRAPGASGQVIQPEGGGAPLIVVQGLPTLPPNQVYQVWVIAGGQPVGAGLLQISGSGSSIIQLDHHLSGVEIVALTVEPPGGSPAPTSAPVMTGKV